MQIKEIVKDNTATMEFYRGGHIYYRIYVNNTPYNFPVNLEDIGTATLVQKEKAIHLMRYIRKAMEKDEFTLARPDKCLI